MIRALAVTWLFAGLRIDEIYRLRVGCTSTSAAVSTEGNQSICQLEVPVNKTGTAFQKPVDGVVAEAIRAWEQVRPGQPLAADRKTGELVHFLFCYRGSQISSQYVNGTLIPLLCVKAGVPPEDARGEDHEPSRAVHHCLAALQRE